MRRIHLRLTMIAMTLGAWCAGDAHGHDLMTGTHAVTRDRAMSLPIHRVTTNDEDRKSDAWADADGEAYGLHPGRNGSWVTGSFRVTCGGSNRLFLETYLTAFILNRPGGDPKCDGGILEIKNGSGRWPAYFGQSGVINQKLSPGETRSIELPIYRSKSDTRSTVETITVKYWKQGSRK